MMALVTGASSGIGRDIARALYKRGYALILTGRNKERLMELNDELGGNNTVFTFDLSEEAGCKALYEKVKPYAIDVLVNNAGFGVFGEFCATSLEKEIEMLHTNARAVHILMKLFLLDFERRGSGYILNVSSSAAFLPGPLMAAYYATKAYVLRLSEAVAEELHRQHSNVKISVLCPGPVKTDFDKTAGVNFSIPALESSYTAEYAVKKMFGGRRIIVPGLGMKAASICAVTADRILAKIAFCIQHRKYGR